MGQTITIARVRAAQTLDRVTRLRVLNACARLLCTGRHGDVARQVADAARAGDLAGLLGLLYDAGARLAVELDASKDEAAVLYGAAADAVRAAHESVTAALVASVTGRQ